MQRGRVDIAGKSERAHPLARRTWALLRSRSEADRRLIYEALSTRISRAETTGNQQIAIAALQRFERLRQERRAGDSQEASRGLPKWADGGPSRRRYNAFRSELPDPKAWPSSQLIANAFRGSWTEALKAAGLAVSPDVLAMRRTNQPAPYTNEEILEVVEGWIATVDADDPERPLVGSDFHVWLERQRREASSTLERWPSRPTVREHLGSWMDVLNRIGQVSRHPSVATARQFIQAQSQQDRDFAARAVSGLELATLEARSSVHGCGNGYSVSELGMWIRRLTAGLDRSEATKLTMTQWDLIRQATLLRLADEQCRLIDIPNSKRIASAPGVRSWGHAKVLAGIGEPADLGIAGTSTSQFGESELEAALIEVINRVGRLPTQSEYAQQRRKILKSKCADDPWARFPTEGTLRQRLSKKRMRWQEVLETICERHPQLNACGAHSPGHGSHPLPSRNRGDKIQQRSPENECAAVSAIPQERET